MEQPETFNAEVRTFLHSSLPEMDLYSLLNRSLLRSESFLRGLRSRRHG